MDLDTRAAKLIKDLPRMSAKEYIDASCSLMADLIEAKDLMQDILTEADKYLDTNKQTSIMHGSLMHQKFKSLSTT